MVATTPVKKYLDPAKKLQPVIPTEETDVSKIAGNMMKEQNPLMQAAAQKGRAAGNARGLLNSSITSGAGVRAALDYVAPLAQQQAAYGQGLVTQKVGIDADAATQGRGLEAAFKQQQIGIDADTKTQATAIEADTASQIRGIQADAASQNRALTAAEKAQIKTIQAQEKQQLTQIGADKQTQATAISAAEKAQQVGIKADSATQQKAIAAAAAAAAKQVAADGKAAAAEYNFRADQSALERAAQTKIANLQLSQNDNKAASDMITSVHSMYTNEVASINANTALSAKERTAQVNAAKSNLSTRSKMIEKLYSVNIDWVGTNKLTPTTLNTK